MLNNSNLINGMTNQKQILVVSNGSVNANSQQLISVQKSKKSWSLKLGLTSNFASKLTYISVTQWILLLAINVVAFGFIAFAYICTRIT